MILAFKFGYLSRAAINLAKFLTCLYLALTTYDILEIGNSVILIPERNHDSFKMNSKLCYYPYIKTCGKLCEVGTMNISDIPLEGQQEIYLFKGIKFKDSFDVSVSRGISLGYSVPDDMPKFSEDESLVVDDRIIPKDNAHITIDESEESEDDNFSHMLPIIELLTVNDIWNPIPFQKFIEDRMEEINFPDQISKFIKIGEGSYSEDFVLVNVPKELEMDAQEDVNKNLTIRSQDNSD
ncbi:unnamed protein product [Gordionus sp. m RMFG-2023]